MIYVSENKAQIVKGDFRPAQFYKGDKKIAGYVKEAFEGEGSITLENCYNDKIHNAKIYGNTVQYDTPAPDNPVEMQSVGDLVTEGEHSGKYKISIKVSAENEEQIFDIYLDEPLRKVGEFADSIDFEKGVVLRKIGKKVYDGTKKWQAHYTKNLMNYFDASDIPEGGYISANINAAANYLPSTPWVTLYGNERRADGSLITGMAGAGSLANKLRYIYVCPYSSQITPDEWKAKLATWYEEGNPFTVLYAVATTEEEVELPEIPTMRGTTTYEILTEIPAKISGKYKKAE